MPHQNACNRKSDAFSYDMHKFLCGKLVQHPELLKKLKERNKQSMETDYLIDSMIYFLQWEEALDQGIEAVVSLTFEKSDRGQVLRSCSAFAVIVDQKWRSQFLRNWNEKYKTYKDICLHELFEHWGKNNPYRPENGWTFFLTKIFCLIFSKTQRRKVCYLKKKEGVN